MDRHEEVQPSPWWFFYLQYTAVKHWNWCPQARVIKCKLWLALLVSRWCLWHLTLAHFGGCLLLKRMNSLSQRGRSDVSLLRSSANNRFDAHGNHIVFFFPKRSQRFSGAHRFLYHQDVLKPLLHTCSAGCLVSMQGSFLMPGVLMSSLHPLPQCLFFCHLFFSRGSGRSSSDYGEDGKHKWLSLM